MSLRLSRLLLFATAALLLAPSAASAAWTVPPTPNVDGAVDTNLSAVDCSSANSCMAVGDALSTQAGMATPNAPMAPISFTSTTVAEHWDGTSWQIVPTPNPPGATFSSLNGVSCPRPRICFAVGDYGTDPNSPVARPLIELWDGTSWSIQPAEDVGNGALGAVSCSGPLACTAVGGLRASPFGGELAMR